ncbi:hypothetical protein LZP69_06755 [Shewanella sp. AS1]|uniref:hypothetical protein n=1 Tax=Shewanella sp. AS1 TaxID=2907626 RepID=UPI001F492967|nr:hypothetical protein [Shewanella sp. AS1]MCE9678884.1 hypothetical protein [Shewanella sp. AS1]
MDSSEESYKGKIRNQVGNIAVVAALNIGFAFFDTSILIDVAIITFFGALIYLYNSRIAALGIIVFGCVAMYLQLPNYSDAGGWRLAALAWLVVAGLISLYYSAKYHAQNT